MIKYVYFVYQWLGKQQAKLFQFLVKRPRSAVEMCRAKTETILTHSDDDDPAEAETC